MPCEFLRSACDCAPVAEFYFNPASDRAFLFFVISRYVICPFVHAVPFCRVTMPPGSVCWLFREWIVAVGDQGRRRGQVIWYGFVVIVVNLKFDTWDCA